YLCVLPPPRATKTSASTPRHSAVMAAMRDGVIGTPLVRSGEATRLLHPQRAVGVASEELTDERVRRVEELLGGAGLDDLTLPQHGDVLRHAAGAHDVVGDDDVGAAVLGVHFLDQFA